MILINSESRMGGWTGEWNRNLNLEKYNTSGFTKIDQQDRMMEIMSLRDFTHLAWVTLKFQNIDNFA